MNMILFPRACFICFYFVCMVLVKGIVISSRKYVVEKDVQANMTIPPLDSFQAASFHVCAAECSKHTDCCSASYNGDSSCKLYNCCFPETVPSTGGKHLRQRPRTVVKTPPKDCSELPSGSKSGVYTIYPNANLQVDVYCDMDMEHGAGWTVVQRRIDGTFNFRQGWEAYKAGFGNILEEFWIGNDILNAITSSKRYILRFNMADYNGVTAYAEYDKFEVDDEASGYNLTIGCYSGTAGDAMYSVNGMKFTTTGRDNDLWPGNYANDQKKGGWWFKKCSFVNPNGLYQTQEYEGFDSIHWKPFKGFYSLASMSMKIKPL